MLCSRRSAAAGDGEGREERGRRRSELVGKDQGRALLRIKEKGKERRREVERRHHCSLQKRETENTS
jgi:hypothetical protein